MVTLIAAALALVLQDAPAPSPSPVTYDGVPPVPETVREDPEDVAGRLARPRMLDLSAYSLYAERRVPLSPDSFYFDTTIEVVGRDPNQTMKDWWRHWNFEYSIYGRGINIQKPMPGGGFNILPVIDWLREKAKERSQNREPEE
jgi:hypothetical protein